LLLDRAEVADTVARYATAADARDWAALRSVFAEEVEVNHPFVTGGETVRVGAEDLVEEWRAALSGYDATQHALSTMLVTVAGDGAACAAQLVAKHYLVNYQGSDSWTLGGRCDHGLVRTEGGWRVASLGLTVLWAEGNRLLPEMARRRFEEGLGGTRWR
jgi:ketosteroid isomerase-like protein